MNDEGLADAKPLTPFVYPDFTQESVRRPDAPVCEGSDRAAADLFRPVGNHNFEVTWRVDPPSLIG
jgi:hypothetical protein